MRKAAVIVLTAFWNPAMGLIRETNDFGASVDGSNSPAAPSSRGPYASNVTRTHGPEWYRKPETFGPGTTGPRTDSPHSPAAKIIGQSPTASPVTSASEREQGTVETLQLGPTNSPSVRPVAPSRAPSKAPVAIRRTSTPTATPTATPRQMMTAAPVPRVTLAPSSVPMAAPIATETPSTATEPSSIATVPPSHAATRDGPVSDTPSGVPSYSPSQGPSISPTTFPQSMRPSAKPIETFPQSTKPSAKPIETTKRPTLMPIVRPTSWGEKPCLWTGFVGLLVILL